MKWFRLLAFCVFAITPVWGQTHTTVTVEDPQTITGNKTLVNSGACTFGGVAYVGVAGCWPGGDIGAQINAAYAALPTPSSTQYVSIKVVPPVNALCYNYSTPILLATSAKPVQLDFQGACLNYTPVTATVALTMDTTNASGNIFHPSAGLLNGTLLNNGGCGTGGGCSSAATGVQFGNTNQGLLLGKVDGMIINGFGTGIASGANLSFNVRVMGSSIYFNTTGINFSNGQEGLLLTNNYISQNGTGITANNVRVEAIRNHFDGNTVKSVNLTGGNGNSTFVSNHFENVNTSLPALFITSVQQSLNVVGGDMLDDTGSGDNASGFIQFTGNNATVLGVGFTSGGRTANEGMVQCISPSRCFIMPQNISSGSLTVPCAGSGQCNNWGLNNGGGTAAYVWNTDSNIKFPAFMATGPTFTASGCGNSTLTGGSTAGSYKSVTAGSCSITLTMGNSASAPNGWVCDAHDITTTADANNVTQSSSNATQAVLAEGTVAANDIIVFKCVGY